MLPPAARGTARGGSSNPEVVERLTEELGLDQPLPVQYVAWLTHMLQGDFGIGTSTERYEVADAVGAAIGPTLWLCFLAFTVAVGIGVPLGLVAALRQRRPAGTPRASSPWPAWRCPPSPWPPSFN